MEVMLSEGSLASRASATRSREKGICEERNRRRGREKESKRRLEKGQRRVALVEMI
jgi:hypothetical protein